jgi:predicted transposase/invertase (TIGR01784 family)
MPSKPKIHQPDDRFFRHAMSKPEVAKRYIEHFYPEIARITDLDSLKLESALSIQPSLREFKADVIYRCRLQQEEEQHLYFCLLLEHKSQPDKYVSVQVGLYIMELMLRSVKEAGRELELVLPIIFYNGKEKWQPLTLAELFAGHPQLSLLQPYIPNFSFVFQDVSQLSTEELLQLDLSFFRSAIMALSLRHQPYLIVKYLRLIFEGADGKASISALTHYILGVAERSEEEFKNIIENTDLEIIPDIMSTLEQILTRGRKEGMEKGMEKGLEKGIQKERTFHLLKTALKFPEMTAADLADFTGLPQETVKYFIDITAKGDKDKLLKYGQEELLADIPLNAEEKEKLQELVEKLLAGTDR